MKPEKHHPLTFSVYSTIMEWLESNNNDIQLNIPVMEDLGFDWAVDMIDINRPVTMKMLRFYRVRNPMTLVPGVVFTRKNGQTVYIWYDPNWKSYLTIEELLSEV